ncbi:MAG: hypothetical protein J6Q69_03360, partial [Clostridia bacterium]|nr:hypothetical protein [Clostridia bacterium]
EDYTQLEKRIKIFYKHFEKQWYMDNKPSGFEVQDGRLGALAQRVDACKRRLIAYVNGKLDKIEELECDILPFLGKEKGAQIAYTCYGRIATANQFTHAL